MAKYRVDFVCLHSVIVEADNEGDAIQRVEDNEAGIWGCDGLDEFSAEQVEDDTQTNIEFDEEMVKGEAAS